MFPTLPNTNFKFLLATLPNTNFKFLLRFILLSANAFNLDQSKIHFCGKELEIYLIVWL